MNTKFVIGLCVVVAVVAGLVGYSLHNDSSFGAGITASNALNQQRLINEFAALASSTAGITQATGNYAGGVVGPLGTSTSTVSANITITGASKGDACVFGTSTSTPYLIGSCNVTAANTATYYLSNASNTAVTGLASVIYVTNLPQTTFVAPVGL